MRQTYRLLAGLIAVGVLVQAAAVAFGWFQVLSEVENGMVFDSGHDGNAGLAVHAIVGLTFFPVLALALLVVSLFLRSMPGARTWGAIVFAVVVLQVLVAFVAFGAPIVGTIHGVNALAVFSAAVRAASLSRETTPSVAAPAHAAVAVPETSSSV